jgi:phenylacetate-CoA ligase
MLQRTQFASADELESLRTGFLRRLIKHAYENTAYYRAALDDRGIHPDDIRCVADVAKLPVLRRADARTSVDQRTAAWPAVAVTKATSGSTGEPLQVRFSAESRHWRDATRWRGFGWGGYRMGMKAMHLWGVSPSKPSLVQRAKLELDRKLRRDVYVSCMVRSDEALAGMVDTLRRERPQAMLGYAQGLADLARYINRHGLRDWDTIPVVYGAERLWPHDRAALEQAFGPEVYETYGCRELTLMGSECEVHDGLHESAENLIVEILVEQPDGSHRVARPGEVGEVAITDLHNLACPFVRYLIGDRALARNATGCACGRTLPRFGPVQGRVTETLRDGAGNPVEGILFNILFTELAMCTRQFQAVQRLDGSVILNLVPQDPSGIPREAEAKIRNFVNQHMRGIPFTICLMPEIPLTKAGKLQRVVVERAAG